MATLSVFTSDLNGLAFTPVAAAGGGDDFPNDGNTVFYVTNGSGGSITVTANSVTACDQGFDHDIVNTVANGATEIMGPFPTARFGDSVAITYSGVTSVTVKPLKVR